VYQPVDGDVLTALARGPYAVSVSCLAYRGGERVAVPLTVTSGSVTMSPGTGTRATLDVSFAPARGLRDALSPSGLVLRPEWIITWGAMGREVVPFGEFLVDSQDVEYDRDSGGVSVTAPDTWTRVVRRRLAPQTPSGRAVNIAAKWVREAHGDLAGEVLSPSTARVWGRRYEHKRSESVRELLAGVGLQAYIDRRRRLVVDDMPDLLAPPTWEVTPVGRSGTFASASSQRSAQDVTNSYSVHPDVPGRFKPFLVEDTNPRSPTRVTGPMGRLTAEEPLVFPGVSDPAIASLAAKARLRRTTSLAFTTRVTAAPNPFIDPDDAGIVTFPSQGGDGSYSEKAIVREVTHPLVPGELMSLSLRSSNPLADQE